MSSKQSNSHNTPLILPSDLQSGEQEIWYHVINSVLNFVTASTSLATTLSYTPALYDAQVAIKTTPRSMLAKVVSEDVGLVTPKRFSNNMAEEYFVGDFPWFVEELEHLPQHSPANPFPIIELPTNIDSVLRACSEDIQQEAEYRPRTLYVSEAEALANVSIIVEEILNLRHSDVMKCSDSQNMLLTTNIEPNQTDLNLSHTDVGEEVLTAVDQPNKVELSSEHIESNSRIENNVLLYEKGDSNQNPPPLPYKDESNFSFFYEDLTESEESIDSNNLQEKFEDIKEPVSTTVTDNMFNEDDEKIDNSTNEALLEEHKETKVIENEPTNKQTLAEEIAMAYKMLHEVQAEFAKTASSLNNSSKTDFKQSDEEKIDTEVKLEESPEKELKLTEYTEDKFSFAIDTVNSNKKLEEEFPVKIIDIDPSLKLNNNLKKPRKDSLIPKARYTNEQPHYTKKSLAENSRSKSTKNSTNKAFTNSDVPNSTRNNVLKSSVVNSTNNNYKKSNRVFKSTNELIDTAKYLVETADKKIMKSTNDVKPLNKSANRMHKPTNELMKITKDLVLETGNKLRNSADDTTKQSTDAKKPLKTADRLFKSTNELAKATKHLVVDTKKLRQSTEDIAGPSSNAKQPNKTADRLFKSTNELVKATKHLVVDADKKLKKSTEENMDASSSKTVDRLFKSTNELVKATKYIVDEADKRIKNSTIDISRKQSNKPGDHAFKSTNELVKSTKVLVEAADKKIKKSKQDFNINATDSKVKLVTSLYKSSNIKSGNMESVNKEVRSSIFNIDYSKKDHKNPFLYFKAPVPNKFNNISTRGKAKVDNNLQSNSMLSKLVKMPFENSKNAHFTARSNLENSIKAKIENSFLGSNNAPAFQKLGNFANYKNIHENKVRQSAVANLQKPNKRNFVVKEKVNLPKV